MGTAPTAGSVWFPGSGLMCFSVSFLLAALGPNCIREHAVQSIFLFFARLLIPD